MNEPTRELARTYHTIGMRLLDTQYSALGMDYCYIATLLLSSSDIRFLVGDLRNYLYRAIGYHQSAIRNSTLRVVAATIERQARHESANA